jgi:tetratricopeptide (TPR) repeat protein
LPDQFFFKSQEAQYELLNFQHEEDLAAITEVLCSRDESRSRAVFLAGEPGIGKRYFLDAAVWRVRRAGTAIELGTIDLAGYDPASGSLETYARHQLAKCTQERDRSRIARILEEAKLEATTGGPHAFAVSALSIALSLELPLKDVLSILCETFEFVPGPERPAREGLCRMLRRLTETQIFVVRVVEAAELPATLSAFLLEEAEINSNLVLAFLCHPRYEWPKEAPLPNSKRFELMPLEEYELRAAVNRRFQPNSFPDELCRALGECSHGLPGKLALKMADLLGAGRITEDARGDWRLAEGGLESEEFSPDLQRPLRTRLSELPPNLREPVGSFLKLAALAGDQIPVTLLLAHLGISGDHRETLLDLLDESFGPDSSQPLFLDFEYRHPGLPGQLVYAFSDPMARLEILRHMTSQERSFLGVSLLAFLEGALPVVTRDAARLFLEIATQAGSEQDQQKYARELAWWIGGDEAGELSGLLQEALRQRRLPPNVVWMVVDGTEYRWPPGRRLAVLDALRAPVKSEPRIEASFGAAQDAQGYRTDYSMVPLERLAEFHYRRARLLHDMGRFPEAQAETALGLECAPLEPLLEAAFHEVAGLVRLNLGELEAATCALEQALAIRSRVLEPDHYVVAASLNNLAEIYKAQGRDDDAERMRMRIQSTAKEE